MDPIRLNSSDDFSWEDYRENALQTISDHFYQMKELWQRMGIDGKIFKDRCDRSLDHYTDLFDRMYEEDSYLHEKLKKSVQTSLQRLEEYSNDLGLSIPDFPDLPPLHLERLINPKLQQLEEIRQARLEHLEDLRQKENYLCECLRMEPHTFENDRPLPTEQDLEELEQHVNMLATEKEQRLRKYCILRSDIMRVMRVLERNPSTDEEQEICSEATDDHLLLSQDRLSTMKAIFEQLQGDQQIAQARVQSLIQKVSLLWQCLEEDQDRYKAFLHKHGHCGATGIQAMEKELERCMELRRANMGQFVLKLREELMGCWDKCLASDEQKAHFEPFFTSEDFSEDLLKAHEREVMKWNKMYEDFEGLFTKLDKFERLFQQALQIQHNANNPDRYNNRGGRLLQEERERKKIIKILPKLQMDLLELAEEYEESIGRPFIVGGVSLNEYLQAQWDAHQQEKENEKIQRKQRRQEEDQGITTPAKRARNFAIPSVNVTGATPFKTPGSSTSVRHMGMTLRSPGTMLGTTRTPLKSRRQLMKSPQHGKAGTPLVTAKSSSKAAAYTPHARTHLREQNLAPTSKYHLRTATPSSTTKGATPSTSMMSMTYNSFKAGLGWSRKEYLNSTALEDKNLNDPLKQASNKRSTMNTSNQKRVLGSKLTPTFTNSGKRRKRRSNAKSPHLQQSALSSKKKPLVATPMPFLY